MNFFKGTGIAGLRAMLPRQDRLVRPLLFAKRATLEDFAREHGLDWVEDSSNESDKYTRNFFRHQLIPLVQETYPSALQNLADNIGRFRDIELIYRQAIEQQKKKLLEYKGSEIHIPVLKLKKSEPLPTLVYEIIHPFGFSPQQTTAVIGLLDSASGKYVLSATHRILKDRNWLIISPASNGRSSDYPDRDAGHGNSLYAGHPAPPPAPPIPGTRSRTMEEGGQHHRLARRRTDRISAAPAPMETRRLFLSARHAQEEKGSPLPDRQQTFSRR